MNKILPLLVLFWGLLCPFTIYGQCTASIVPFGPTTFCQGGVVVLQANGGPSPQTYLWSNGATTQTISVTTSGNYSVRITHSNGCSATSIAVNITVNAQPTVYALVGNEGAICELDYSGNPSLFSIGISGSQVGVNYTLYRDNISVTSLIGQGNSLFFNAQHNAGTYSIKGISQNGCEVTMIGQKTISFQNSPQVLNFTGNGSYCPFETLSVPLTLANSQTNVKYQLVKNGQSVSYSYPYNLNEDFWISGTNSTLTWQTGISGTYKVLAYDPANQCYRTMNGQITVAPIAASGYFTVSGGGVLCTNDIVGKNINTSNSTTGIKYQLKRNGTDYGLPKDGVTGSGLSWTNILESGQYTIWSYATLETINCGYAGDGSATISQPTIFAGDITKCNASTQQSVAISSNVPGTTFNYIVKSATSNVSGYSNGTGNTINQYLTNNSATTGTVVYTVSAVGNGCSGFSDKDVTVMVHPSPSAVITPSSSTNICLGESVTLNANIGTDLSYQWFKGGVTIPNATSASYTASSAGNYTVQVTNLSTGCSGISASTVVSLVKCNQTITFNALSSKTYGDLSFNLTATASSGLPVTYTSSNSSVATVSGNTVTITGAGSTTITASQAGNVDFFAAPSVPQTLTVTKAILTATANGNYRTYGAANPTLTISYSGFVNGETASVIDTSPTANTPATITSNVGNYPITPSGGTDNNYTFTYVNGTLTVNKAVLQVTADNKSRAYGATNPSFTISYSGFVNGETAAVIDTPPTASTTAGLTSNAGTYPISPSGGTDNNYSFNYVNGTLTVNKATIQATANASRPYNTTNPAFTIVYTGLLNGETGSVIDTPPTATTSATISSPVGSYSITLSGGTDNNYTITLVNGTLTITKANQTVTFSPIPTKCGTGTVSLVASSSSGLAVTFSSSNTAIATISGSTANALQTGTVTITATQAGNGNYNAASATQSLVIASLPARPSITQIGCVCDQYVTLQASGGSNYVWSTGYVGQTVNMVTSADYYVTSTNASGCSRQSFTFTATIPSCASDPCGGGPQSRMSNNSEPDELKVTEATLYPNPADASLTVDLPEPVKQNLKVSLCSQYGQEVKSAVIVKGEHKIDFDTKSLSKGMYVLTLRSHAGAIVMNRKVIIAH
ncbi:MAG TPA: MBG domain-containing protein [Cyclobacteriaceae bacterium]|nr:MBG domain-containing protein [Cyclobacteriaceae bacterium]